MKRILFMILLLVTLPLANFAFAQYQSVATPGFKVYYRNGWEEQALKVLQIMENHRPYVEDLTGNSIGQSIMILEDMGNEVNGYTDLLGDRIALFAYPPTADELSNGEDWWQLVGIHEYIHQSQMSTASGIPGFLRKVFGNGFYPSIHQPNWVTEGITVYGESNISPNTGRMRGGYYNNVITAMAREGKLPNRAKATIYSKDNPLASFYVFGGSFFSYLAQQYGKDKFAQLFELQGASPKTYLSTFLPALSTNGYFKKVYGLPLKRLWDDWREFEANRDLDLPQDRITFEGGSCSNLQSSSGKLYYSRHVNDATGPFSQFTRNYIARVPEGDNKAAEEILLSQATDFPAGFQVRDNVLYYTRSEFQSGFANNENNGLGAVTELWRKNLQTGDTDMLLSGSIRSFCVLTDGNILVATDVDNYRQNSLALYSPSGELISEPRVVKMLIANMMEHDGKLFLTGKEEWNCTSIYEASLPELKFQVLINTSYSEKLVGISSGYLIFDVAYDDQLRSYAFSLESGQTFKISNLSGLRSSVLSDNGKFYTIGMHSGGEDIYRADLNLARYALPQYNSGSLHLPLPYSKEQPLISGKYPVQKGSYWSNLSHLIVPRFARIPYVMGSPDSLSLGLFMMGRDIVGDFPGWTSRLQYDLKAKDFGIDISFSNNLFRPVLQELRYSSLGEGSFSADQYINLLNSKNYGLNRLWLGCALTGKDDFERKIWDGYCGANLSWEGGRLGINQAMFVEEKDVLQSDRNRLGYQTRINLKQKIGLDSQFIA